MKVVTTNVTRKVGSPKVATSWGCWASVSNPLINHMLTCVPTMLVKLSVDVVTPTRWHGTWHDGRINGN